METKLGWSPYQGFSLISFFADSISYLQVLYVFPQLAVEGMAAEKQIDQGFIELNMAVSSSKRARIFSMSG